MMTRHRLRVKSRPSLTLSNHLFRSDPGRRPLRLFALTSLLLLHLCFPGHPALAQTPLLVFAASSLSDAFLWFEEEFEQRHPDIDVVLNLASSSTLATQLLLGAQADVFASADEAQMARLQEANLVDESRIVGYNTLVLAIPSDNPAGLTTVAELARPGLRLVLAAPGVPIRRYTDELLARLAMKQHMEVSDVLANVVSEESNVRQVLFRVGYGGADAGFVYRSDVTADLTDRVNVIPLSEDINVRAIYPVAITEAANNPEAARSFVDFLLSADGQRALGSHGFVPAIPEPAHFFRSSCRTAPLA